MKVRFWGTRGSVPKPGPTTVRYGGNTSCVELRADDGTLVVLDCGTGAHELGRHVLRNPPPGKRAHLLIGHTHWDHILGFPFFAPLFAPDFHWTIYAPGDNRAQLERALRGQMSYEFFPLRLDDLAARIEFCELREGELDLGGLRLRTHYLNHPALTLGYRLEADGASVAYCTDHEPHSLQVDERAPLRPPVHHEDRDHQAFLAGTDVLIHDAQYTLADFPAKRGWGHTPVERLVDDSVRGGVEHLVLFHHDPDRTDEQVDALVEAARARVAGYGATLEVSAAAEGASLEVRGESPAPGPIQRSALLGDTPAPAATVLVIEDDQDTGELLKGILEEGGARVVLAETGEGGVAAALREEPSLIILDWELPGMDGLGVCRILRQDHGKSLGRTPVVFLTGIPPTEDRVLEAFQAGATDFLSKPIQDSVLRTRVRTWLSRAR